MKKLLIALLLFTVTGVKAQLSTNQRAQVTTMIATAVNPLKADIAWLKAGKRTDSLKIAQLTANIKVLTDSLNKFRPTIFMPPLYVNPGQKMDSVFLIIPKQ